ncbi:hypothetical protein O181_084057 [Austropuccinia psidii MF-1]|uniref:Uncharacterized protein n=1 Tax=Austropuccinia psidii MF-1 TaxID=1389203 RepID=A0A9Q3FTH6_9BASI|nr:hypothetical protein [Austropuccinia psidii MF-1]
MDGEEIPNSGNTHSPRNFQPVLSTFPPPSPSPSPSKPALVSTVRPSPIPQPRSSPMGTSQQLRPVVSSSRRREDHSPLPFPASQVFKQRKNWPIQLIREDPNMEHEGPDGVTRLFGRVDRNSRGVIMYANDRTIPGTASEAMCHNHGNPPSWTSIWYIHAISNIWQFGHIHNHWQNWPLSCLMALMVILSSGANLAPSPSSSHSRLSL